MSSLRNWKPETLSWQVKAFRKDKPGRKEHHRVIALPYEMAEILRGYIPEYTAPFPVIDNTYVEAIFKRKPRYLRVRSPGQEEEAVNPEPITDLPERPPIEAESTDNLVTDLPEPQDGWIDARALHKFLVIDTKFVDWIKYRITQYGFLPEQDYKKASEISDTSGQAQVDYALSVSMAKELCMVENNERGKMARRYYIKLEEESKNKKPDGFDMEKMALLMSTAIGTAMGKCMNEIKPLIHGNTEKVAEHDGVLEDHGEKIEENARVIDIHEKRHENGFLTKETKDRLEDYIIHRAAEQGGVTFISNIKSGIKKHFCHKRTDAWYMAPEKIKWEIREYVLTWEPNNTELKSAGKFWRGKTDNYKKSPPPRFAKYWVNWCKRIGIEVI